MTEKIVVGSRGSKLAVVQTRWLLDRLAEQNPGIDFDLRIIKTKGDKIQHKALDAIGDKGLFTKELEEGLLDKSIQMAVHSMKDMPSSLPSGLVLSFPPKREDPRDVLVTKKPIASILDLPKGATIATGSKRRVFQLKAIREDLNIVGIRGNIDTRLRKLQEENLDGIILAAAGMKRINVFESDEYYCLPLDPKQFICAPAQGILAVEVSQDNDRVSGLLKTICDETTRIQMAAERGFLESLNGDCHLPIGAYCDVEGDDITLYGIYGDEDGRCLVRGKRSGKRESAAEIGLELAEELRSELAEKLSAMSEMPD